MNLYIVKKNAIAIICAGLSPLAIEAMLSIETTGAVVIVNDNTKAILPAQNLPEREEININPYTGGLDYNPYSFDMPIMSPKEYGLSIYHGNKCKRSNRLRFSHNAKLKRRK